MRPFIQKNKVLFETLRWICVYIKFASREQYDELFYM